MTGVSLGGGGWGSLQPQESGLKVLVDGRDVGHDALPVRPLCVHHLVYVLETRAGSASACVRARVRACDRTQTVSETYQSAFDAHALRSLESQSEVPPLRNGEKPSH